MGREVRMVPKGWQHPMDDKRNYVPLMNGAGGAFKRADAEWNEGYEMWQKGMRKSWGHDEPKWVPLGDEYRGMTYTEWAGKRPSPDEYMPDWPQEKCTQYVMYEDTSEGTPISPAFDTPEELARWLADNGASAFGDMTATYEQWLATIKRGFAVGMVLDGGGLRSGVAM